MSLFITFEGPEGSGKTTQIQRLAAWLREQGQTVLATREPGGTAIGDRVRAILLDSDHREMQPQTEILLFSAARAQIVGQIIRPHLARGGVVLCDRFADSTLAYQGYGRQLDLATLRLITAFATGGLQPDLTFCLDLPVDVGLQRKAAGAGEEWNRMEQETLAFHARVRRGYLTLAQAEPARWRVLDATQPVQALQAAMRAEVAARLGLLAEPGQAQST
ncbi:dTMP kinase [Candidatus Amarolinea aalborgensis]|uniref:dTMP kinase n=1 Tax=Candidatus Amarolinea aalborgensis TaxID=2249329 RepID=UPI003BF94640